MLTLDLGSLLQNPAMRLGDVVKPAVGSFDDRLATAIAAAMSEKDVKRPGVTPGGIAAAPLTGAQSAKDLSHPPAEPRERIYRPVTAAAHALPPPPVNAPQP